MKRLGIFIGLIIAISSMLCGCADKTPPPPKNVDVTSITVVANNISGKGTVTDPFRVKIALGGGAHAFDYSIAPNDATDKKVNIKYVTVVAGTVNETTSSPYIELKDVTATSFNVNPIGIGTGYLQLKSNDGAATGLVEISVYLRDSAVNAECAAYTPAEYYHRDEQGDVTESPTGGIFKTVPAINPFTGEPIMNGDVVKQEQIRNIYSQYVNGFDTVPVAEKSSSVSKYYNADYRFVGIENTTLNATFGELVHNKENFNNVSMISSTNDKSDVNKLDKMDRVRYYKNMVYNTFTVKEDIADKTLKFKYYSDGALTTEVPAANSPIMFNVKDNDATKIKKQVSFTAPKSGEIWVKTFCGADEIDYSVIKVEILPAYGAGVQKTDFDNKTSSTKMAWDFIGSETNPELEQELLAEWNSTILQSSNKFQVKTFYYGATETAGNTSGYKGLQISNRFEVFTNMGLTGYEVELEKNETNMLKSKYMLPFDLQNAMGSFWNKVTLPASGVTQVTAKVKATHDKTTVGDFRIRLFTADGASVVGEWSNGAEKASEAYDITLNIPTQMLGKDMGIVIESRVTNPVYNQDSQMIVLGVSIL